MLSVREFFGVEYVVYFIVQTAAAENIATVSVPEPEARNVDAISVFQAYVLPDLTTLKINKR